MADDSLRVIGGPTASGKSAIVLALAAHFPLTVISADSRQIYRGFDIGTAKPAAAERAKVPHLGIDVIAPTERFSAAAWAERAAGWIAEARAAGRTPVIVGGTGFYIRALVAPLFAEPPIDPEERIALAAKFAPLPTEELRRRTQRLDPARAHLGRAQLLRALEVALLTGKPISHWQAQTPGAARFKARYLVVDPGPVLKDWIAARVDSMLEAGWEAEVHALARTVPDDAPAWNATGYAVVRELARGRLTRAEAVARITIATRQYAKRQRTWFRHQLGADDVTRLVPHARPVVGPALEWWTGGGIA